MVPSTSGPWWAGAALDVAVRRRDSTSTSTLLADPLLGALGVELLDQVGDVLGPGAISSSSSLSSYVAASVPSSSE